MTSPAIKALVKAECPAFEPFSVDELNKLPDPEKLPYPLNHEFIEDALSNGKVVSEIDQQTNQDGRVTYTEFVENISKFIETVDPSYKELHRRLSQTYCKIAQNPHAYFVDISEKISKIKSNPEKFAEGHCKDFSPIPFENAKWYIDTIKKIEPSQISKEQIALLKQFHEIIKFDSIEEGGNNDGLLQWTEIQGGTPNICDYRDIFKAIDETKKNSDQENKKTKQEGLINLLHQTNWAKYQQETADHTGNGGIVLSTLTRFFSRGSWSWNDYFQKERPVGHFEKRKQAIETLATLFREKNIQKFEDAFALMRMQGQSEALHVLKQECKLDEYVRAFEKNDANEISESLLNIAIQAREGEYKFWEFPLIPLPRLGEGSLAQRASHLENWTLKSPELSLSAGLLNHVGTKTPNAYDFFHQRNENGEIHFDQFLREGSIEKHKSRLSELFQKNTLTEEDKKEFEAMLAQSTLNGEQKKYLQQVFELQKG
ncbi:MAG: hypothetical protein JNK65_00325, partial [Deltaproteobacteria bacterium]|nr:hypothetical protein [Deltaproteobacteria bacterium]